ncbi:Esterase/lipase [Metarhizium robertsii ARSEF 23]|uniref:Esterase/lipase n=1 Tax=Metarhizium robertsii (strain ARSEF 23 / ATCC MYA-3075) TaxID=655844 RepID=A0A0B2XEC8_METRA|nr:Esterase/lipase [Metarhizium robertsii ARSEF 23]KHO11075.1 Esterase/lipase [Metarhizium robertsii ARSEF 23]
MGHRLVGAVTSSTKLFVIAGRLFRLVGSFDQRPLTPAVASLSYYGTTNEAADLVQDGHSMNKLSMVVLRRCLLIRFFFGSSAVWVMGNVDPVGQMKWVVVLQDSDMP